MSSQPRFLSLVPEPVACSTRRCFAVYPWCIQLLDDLRYVPVRTYHQHPTAEFSWHFTSVVLRDHDTIRAVQTLSVRDPPPPSGHPQAGFYTLYALGAGGSGKLGTLHGGITAALLGQQASALLAADPGLSEAHSVLCKVQYFHAITIPGAVKVKAWKTRRDGRKQWIMTDVEDDKGRVLAEAEVLFVIVSKNKL